MSASFEGTPPEPGEGVEPLGGRGTWLYGEEVERDLSEPAFGDMAESSQAFDALFEVPAEPQKLGQYAVLGTVGRGAMGTVFEAFDPAGDRRVALKVLHPDLPQRHRDRLVREARAMARLTHPNVARVYEVGEAEGRTYIATELVRGCTLTKWLEREPRPSWQESLSVYLQAGEGLAAAHAEGFVHRDFKPGSAVIDEQGRVRLLEFGLQQTAATADDAGVDLTAIDPEERVSLMGTGAVLGTPAYMPLEQMKGQVADARGDQFGFCVSLYEAIYGERPFDDSSMDTLIESMTRGDVRPAPEGSAVPPKLREVLLRGLSPEPSERWPSMEPLLVALRQHAKPWRRWVAPAATVAAIVGLGVVGVLLGSAVSTGGGAKRCDPAAAPLRGVWDADRKALVREAIVGTERSFARDTWHRVEQGLDAYAQGWTMSYDALCEASEQAESSAGPQLEARAACLSDRLGALGGMAGALAKTDEATVHAAVETMELGLPALRACGGDGVEATASLDDAVAKSRHGVAFRRQGQLANATKSYVAARSIFEGTLGPRSVVVARLLTNEGVVLTAEGKPAEALQSHREALSIREEALGPQHPDVAASLTNIGAVLGRQGKFELAQVQCERALQIYENAYGPRHVQVAAALVRLGQLALARHQFEQARDYAGRAVKIWETAGAAQVVPASLAQARFVLAQALLPSKTERSRALELAQAARDAYAELGTAGSKPRAEVDAWLSEAKARTGGSR